jgi:5-methylthioadenosine/S-adenosylhomocysteine deaminase
MPYYKLRAAGVPMCLGSDEIASDDSLNMWFVAKTSALLQTVGNPEYREWPDGAEILAMATAGGAAAMRMGEQLGRIEAGCLADIVLLDLDTASFTPLNDLRRQLIYCEDGSSVRFTIVAGRVVFENGSPAGLDARAIRQEARSLMERHRATLGQAKEQAARLEPYYRRMYLRAASTDVGMSRWLTP